MSRIEDIKARLKDATGSWPEPWDMEPEIKGDGHWDNEFHVNTEDGEGMNLATFQFRCHAELFAALPQDLRILLEVAEAAKALRDTAPGASTSCPDGRGGPIVRSNEYSRLRVALSRLDGEPTDA